MSKRKRAAPDQVSKTSKNGQVNDVQTLHIKFPTKRPPKGEIKELHPKIVGIHVPRQTSGRYCFITFMTTEDTNEALKALNGKMFKSKGHLVVSRSDRQLKTNKKEKKVPESTSSDLNASSLDESSAESETE